MKKFEVTLSIEAETLEEAKQILAERVYFYEEYEGVGDYVIDANEDELQEVKFSF